MEEEGAAGRLWVFRAIPGFLLECRFSWAGSHEGYSGVVLKTWGVKIVVTVRPSRLRARRGGRARRDRPG